MEIEEMSSQCLSNLKMPTQWLKEKKQRKRRKKGGKKTERKGEHKGEREEDLWEMNLSIRGHLFFSSLGQGQ